ncbi:putative site-specific integrase-resolvase [Sphingopyxis panaciterrae]|uniref:recombinase family protein n=1 Tax=Sphingopyxis panaciterrae TaxID=363841 RepID=UPI001423699C|nr:recombinase family protein [Sphingopyxis panaciterrae]NIJ38529.1 putative site-specific integrase-resolvase [Sphingopyxis panaciterrae]
MAKDLILTGPGAGLTPAVQYVRMSTEHQRYSLDNQRIFIASFAAHQGFEILKTYEDAGKSGLTLDRRLAVVGRVSTHHVLPAAPSRREGREQRAPP